MQISLSVLISGIRNERWARVYDSITQSYSGTFEVVFVGPYPLPQELQLKDNIKYFRDFGSPNRCQQIAACLAEGILLTVIADDCLFEVEALDDAIFNFNDCDVMVTKYTEGGDTLHHNAYFTYGNAYPKSPYINPNWWIFNSAIYRSEYFKRMGGFNCIFNVPCIAHADLGARCWREGCKVGFSTKSLCKCGHMPDRSGDHGPIHDSQTLYDQPLFTRIWNGDAPPRIHIDMDNWKQSEKRWSSRFGK